MLTKIYAIHGKSTVVIRIPSGRTGKAYISCEFQRGRPVSGPYYRPATYATSSSIEQSIIENSPYFKNSTITLFRTFGSVEEKPAQASAKKAAAAAPAPAVEKAPEAVVLGDVVDRETLIEALKAHGAKAAVLASDDKMKAYMEKNNLVAPKYQF